VKWVSALATSARLEDAVEEATDSLLSDIAVGFIVGFGAESYRLGLLALVRHLSAEGA